MVTPNRAPDATAVRSEPDPSLVELDAGEDFSPLQLKNPTSGRFLRPRRSDFNRKSCEKLQLGGRQLGAEFGARCVTEAEPRGAGCRTDAEQNLPAAFSSPSGDGAGFYPLWQKFPGKLPVSQSSQVEEEPLQDRFWP